MKNELILEDVLTINNEDDGMTLRAAVLNMNMVQMTVYGGKHPALLLFSEKQMDQLVALWSEWRDK